MKNSIKLLIIFFLSGSINAQDKSVTFTVEDIQNMALRYTGDTLNWPIIVSLSDKDILNNTYTLTESDFHQLRIISNITVIVTEQKHRLRNLITDGASIFAKDELISATSAINLYNEAIKNANGNVAAQLSKEIKAEVDRTEYALRENRITNIQAKLDHKIGKVDKRNGILGSWKIAQVGELFEESDGLKTGSDSQAKLNFADGTNIIIDPSTTAIIRKSSLDRLDDTSNTEISLKEGGLLAKLSKLATLKNTYIINAGSSQTRLESTNFYAESDNEDNVILTNYDGIATVSANDVTITIRENEGTLIKKGEAPIPPVKLLPAPKFIWASNDTVIYTEQIIFPFEFVDNASSYIVERSTSINFDTSIEKINISSNTALLSYIPIGNTYLRIRSVDRLGLKGPYSETITIIRKIDNEPPPTFIDNLNGNIIFTQTNSVTLSGVTQPDATLLINNENIKIDPSGSFSYQLENLTADQMVSVIATDNSGNNTIRAIRVVHITDEILFNFALSGASGLNPIIIDSPTITFSSRAYPGLDVIINNAGSEKRVETDPIGRWSITMNVKEGDLSISFKDSQTGKTYLSKSYEIDSN
jgi:hypothetical protein